MTVLMWLLAWSGGFCTGVVTERVKRRRNPSTYSRK